MGQGHAERQLEEASQDGTAEQFAEGALNLIQPRNDRVLVKRLPEPERIGLIIVPDVAKQKGILGEVVAVGPGKWVPGEWWRSSTIPRYAMAVAREWETYQDSNEYWWEWIDGHREPLSVHPGQKVYFNAKWNDFAGDYLSDLPVGHDPMLHLIQEADIFLA